MIENIVDIALFILVMVGVGALGYGVMTWAFSPNTGDEPEEESPFDVQVQEAKVQYTWNGMVALRVMRDKLTPVLLSAIPTAYRTGADDIWVSVVGLDEARDDNQPYIQLAEHDRDIVIKHRWDDSFYKQIITPELRKHVEKVELKQDMNGFKLYYTLVITLK